MLIPAPAATFVYRHTRIQITTERPAEVIDLTDGLATWVAGTSVAVGFLNVQSLHTTTGIAVSEHEPRLLSGFEATLELFPSSVCLDIVDGRLMLERCQRVFLVERDGPRDRAISVLLMGESR